MLTIESAARITAVIVGIGILQGSLQLLLSVKEFGSSGLFDWNSRQITAGSRGASRGWMVGHTGLAWLRFVVIARIVCSIALITP